jgi:hypothetical protein
MNIFFIMQKIRMMTFPVDARSNVIDRLFYCFSFHSNGLHCY